MRGLMARLRSLWRGLRGLDDVEAEMAEEFRLHVELRTEDLIRSGLDPAEARRRARLEFGPMEHYREEGRASRGLKLFDDLRFSWLDFKVGFRMLRRYPGLTLVGGIAMAFAIWAGAGMFELLAQVVRPKLPLDQGDRIVALRNWDAAANLPEPQALHDFVTWRGELKSVQDLGAFRSLERNLITGEEQGEPVEVAEISASAFRVARVPPLLGRSLVEADEQPGAPPVVLIGHDAWQRWFGGDPAVVGRTVRLGTVSSTVVGVMPPGFGFPIAHSVWIPLRLNAREYERRAIQIFGRLAPGATLGDAQAELATLGRRAAADFPTTHEHLRPQVMPYAQSVIAVPVWLVLGLMSWNLVPLMLLLLICANVAMLMFARAASRESEIVVRNALGASRGRIITQLFSEALVLGGLAAVIGLAAAGVGLRWVLEVVESEFLDGARLPFWIKGSLSPVTVVYAGVLTVLAAVMAGVVPALKVTGGVSARLKQATAGGGGLQFGGLWTAVIVTQVAVTVAFPAIAFYVRRDAVQIETLDVGFPVEEYLSVRLGMERDTLPVTAFEQRFAQAHQELELRLKAEPAVTGVTFAERLPRMYHPWNQIEVDDGAVAPPDARGHRVSSAAIDVSYFEVLGTPILSGRGFGSGDLASGVQVAIVNQPFVDRVLGGRNPIGRRVRYVAGDDSPRADADRWFEIIGVARDMGMVSGYGRAGIYHPVAPGGSNPVHLAVHVKGDPASFAPRLRAAATAVDPALRLHAVVPLDHVIAAELQFYAFWFRITLLVSSIALLLSLAGVYAVMAFTVARRTREIGVRVALGAEPRRIVLAIFRRPLSQVGLGVVAGGGLVTVMTLGMTGGVLSAKQIGAVVGYGALMMCVCMLACIVPTRRALRVQPTEALREG